MRGGRTRKGRPRATRATAAAKNRETAGDARLGCLEEAALSRRGELFMRSRGIAGRRTRAGIAGERASRTPAPSADGVDPRGALTARRRADWSTDIRLFAPRSSVRPHAPQHRPAAKLRERAADARLGCLEEAALCAAANFARGRGIAGRRRRPVREMRAGRASAVFRRKKPRSGTRSAARPAARWRRAEPAR
jgi:hypothetical protein